MPDKQSLGGFMDDENFGIQATNSIDAESMLSFLTSDDDDEEQEVEKQTEEKKPIIKKKAEVKKVPAKTEESEEDSEEDTEEKEPVINLEEALFSDEEEQDEDKEDEEDQESKGDEEKETEESPFSDITKTLIDIGVFRQEDGEIIDIKEPEAFADRFKLEVKKQAIDSIDAFLGKFGDDYREMFDAVFGNGVNPKDYLSKYVKLVDLANINEESLKQESVQEGLVRSLLQREGRDAAKIDARIQKMKNLGELESEALEALEILREKEADDLRSLSDKQAQETELKTQQRRQYQQSVNSILVNKVKEKEFDGIPLDQTRAQKTFAMLTQEKYRTATGESMTEFEKKLADLNDPQNHAKKVKVALLLQILDEDPTLSTIQKRAVSKETNRLFKGIQEKAAKTGKPDKAKAVDPAKKSWF